jgi:hypothetical protein
VGGVRHSDTVLVTDLEDLMVRGAKPVQRLVGALTRRAVGLD